MNHQDLEVPKLYHYDDICLYDLYGGWWALDGKMVPVRSTTA